MYKHVHTKPAGLQPCGRPKGFRVFKTGGQAIGRMHREFIGGEGACMHG